MQWPLTSQLHGSGSQREQLVFLLRIKLHAQCFVNYRSSPNSWATAVKDVLIFDKTGAGLRSGRILFSQTRLVTLISIAQE
jgi:hypothetical protein